MVIGTWPVEGPAATGRGKGHRLHCRMTCDSRPSLDEFVDVIDQCKVQWPFSSPPVCAPPGYSSSTPSCEDYAAGHFRLDSSGKYMVFEVKGSDGERSELSQLRNWGLADGTENKMIAEVKIYEPTQDTTAFTFLQIHSRATPPGGALTSSRRPVSRPPFVALASSQRRVWRLTS